MNTLTLDELIDWLSKLRKGQEGTIPTNIKDIVVTDEGAEVIHEDGSSHHLFRGIRIIKLRTQ